MKCNTCGGEANGTDGLCRACRSRAAIVPTHDGEKSSIAFAAVWTAIVLAVGALVVVTLIATGVPR